MLLKTTRLYKFKIRRRAYFGFTPSLITIIDIALERSIPALLQPQIKARH
jgi:hypothetical protein